MPGSSEIRITVDRDSVCAGDDGMPHRAEFTVSPRLGLLDLLHAAWRACPLAGIDGGRATWLIDVGGSGVCIGVMAQQWRRPRLLIPPDTRAADLFSGHEPSLLFRYWCQADPDAVFAALRSNAPLPDRYSR